jgi:hypothetical protein
VRARLADFEAERHNQQAREEALKQKVAEEEARSAGLAAQLAQKPSQRGPSVPSVASLVLLPGVSRGQANRAQLLVPSSVQLARIEVQLEARDEYPRFRAELRTAGGEDTLIRGNLRTHRSSAGRAVMLDVPASALATGEYELALKGVASRERTEDVGYYYFSVQKK